MSDYAYYLKQLQRTDPELYGLPHPKIAKLVGAMSILNGILGDQGTECLKELFRRLDLPKGELITRAIPSHPELLNLTKIGGKEGKINMAALELYLAPLRFYANAGRIFEIDKELDELLGLTDIGAATPIEFFRNPFSSTYFHFKALASGLPLNADQAGTTKLMGAYVTELAVAHPEQIREAELFLKWAKEGTGLQCFEVTLVGYPLKTIADHGCVFLRLYVGEKMHEMTVSEVLDLNFEYHKASRTYGTTPEQEEQLRAGVTHLAKAMLFINSQSVRREEFFEETTLGSRLKGLGAKKQSKHKRRLERAYDRIRISIEPSVTEGQGEEGRGSVRAHWRRGHFRHQPFGPSRAQSKLLWIRPMRVGTLKKPDEPGRSYTVKA